MNGMTSQNVPVNTSSSSDGSRSVSASGELDAAAAEGLLRTTVEDGLLLAAARLITGLTFFFIGLDERPRVGDLPLPRETGAADLLALPRPLPLPRPEPERERPLPLPRAEPERERLGAIASTTSGPLSLPPPPGGPLSLPPPPGGLPPLKSGLPTAASTRTSNSGRLHQLKEID